MKLDIFYKKRYDELQKQHKLQKNLYAENLEVLEKKYTENLCRDRDWTKQLLFEKNELEHEIKSLKKKTKQAEMTSECFRRDNEIYKSDLEIISTKNQVLLEANRMLKASLGGTTKKNNKLLQELGIMKLKVEFMEGRLKEYKLPSPTMNELWEYERTRKSPRNKSKKEGIKNV